jgi:hypothetical protein
MSARSQERGERSADEELKHGKHGENYFKHCIAQNDLEKSRFELYNALECLQIDLLEAQIVNQAHDISKHSVVLWSTKNITLNKHSKALHSSKRDFEKSRFVCIK